MLICPDIDDSLLLCICVNNNYLVHLKVNTILLINIYELIFLLFSIYWCFIHSTLVGITCMHWYTYFTKFKDIYY